MVFRVFRVLGFFLGFLVPAMAFGDFGFFFGVLQWGVLGQSGVLDFNLVQQLGRGCNPNTHCGMHG